ncbi:hypothetical protein C8R42DRAFT_108613 [Lentinula raphanica]|nr:hypothetical protein C8R42DRAFT_108613 [Lentinula raphanica]
MPMRYPVTASDIDTAARATITGLKAFNLDCYLVGSVACAAYGMSRTPNDIDMVVLTSQYTQEQLKYILVRYDSRFYLIDSKDPNATYRVLWFRLTGYHRSCKVDLLLPGIMNIPSVEPARIVRVGDIVGAPAGSILFRDYPLMPFLPLLLLKLQAWQDHGESPKLFVREKQQMDVRDIRELLQLAEDQYALPKVEVTGITATSTGTRKVTVAKVRSGSRTEQSSLLRLEAPHLLESFIQAGRMRVRKFVRLHPWSEKQWRLLGFVSELSTTAASTNGNIAALRSSHGDVQRLGDLLSTLAIRR